MVACVPDFRVPAHRRRIGCHLSHFHRRGSVGLEHPGGVGVRYHQLRVLDRHRARRHTHFGHSLPVPAEVADEHQPLLGSHDYFRRDLCWSLSGHSRWPLLVCVVHVSIAELKPYFPELPLRSPVGSLRGFDLLHNLADLLVHRSHPGPWHASRPGEEPHATGRIWIPRTRLAGKARGTGGITRLLTSCWRG